MVESIVPQIDFQNVAEVLKSIGPVGMLEIVILLILAYRLWLLLRHTRAERMVKGLLILVAICVVAQALHLQIITYILERSVYFFVAAAAVVFAPELRRVLERVGSLHFFRSGSMLGKMEIDQVLQAVVDAVANLSRRQVGALICFERETGLQEIIDSGIQVDALISSGLLINIFEKNTPLHDGAVVVRGNRVAAATCYLPMTEQILSKDLGTRHRAAVGLSEQSDALTIVVSEETGKISATREGQILRFLTPDDVRALLTESLYRRVNSSILSRLIDGCFTK